MDRQVRVRVWSGRYFCDYYTSADGARDYAERKMDSLMESEPDIIYDRYEILPDDRDHTPTASQMGRKGGKSKSDAKTAAARENAKKGGRPPICAECKERCEPGLKPVWMKYRKRDGLWHAIEVPLCIDHRNVGWVRYKGRYCTSAN